MNNMMDVVAWIAIVFGLLVLCDALGSIGITLIRYTFHYEDRWDVLKRIFMHWREEV